MKAEYAEIVVESYQPHSTAGKHGQIHIRPIDGQGIFKPEMNVECSKKLSEEYPVGTKFRIKAKIISREGSAEFIYSSYRWVYEEIK